MNEEQKQVVIKFELPQVVNVALTPLAKSIGNTMDHLWGGFTMGIDEWYDKKKIQHDQNLLLYKKELAERISNIPEDNIQEPNMSIVGPALEASKFYFEESQYREMFSKLIASSIDATKNDKVHPFFVEAIKQMKPKDARLLSKFKDCPNYPIANYLIKLDNNYGNLCEASNVIYIDNAPGDPFYYSSSIVNLERLGFVDIVFDQRIIEEEAYTKFKTDPYLLQCKEQCHNFTFQNPNYKAVDVIIAMGVVSTTPLGQDFLDICI